MTDLTEKLNAERLYYVKKKNGKIVIRQAHLYSCLITEKATPYVDFDDNDIEKVLAPVPSYDELQSLEADRLAKNEGEEIVSELKEENVRLREIIKYCVVFMKYAETSHNLPKIIRKAIHELLTKIEEALK